MKKILKLIWPFVLMLLFIEILVFTVLPFLKKKGFIKIIPSPIGFAIGILLVMLIAVIKHYHD